MLHWGISVWASLQRYSLATKWNDLVGDMFVSNQNSFVSYLLSNKKKNVQKWSGVLGGYFKTLFFRGSRMCQSVQGYFRVV